MKKCTKCGAELSDESKYCDACGTDLTSQPVFDASQNTEKKKLGKAYAVCALVFGILGGWLGLVFGILGLRQYKGPEYSSERVMSILGIVFFGVNILLMILM